MGSRLSMTDFSSRPCKPRCRSCQRRKFRQSLPLPLLPNRRSATQLWRNRPMLLVLWQLKEDVDRGGEVRRNKMMVDEVESIACVLPSTSKSDDTGRCSFTNLRSLLKHRLHQVDTVAPEAPGQHDTRSSCWEHPLV
mmetsp:Transcript_23063/g.74471  ORF Transcript_23063/g.74471 Transcript_23063/m.74471 type:complete len:137 (-) Transcript_23063:279-689(-)